MHASLGRRLLLAVVFLAVLIAVPLRGAAPAIAAPTPCADLIVTGISVNPAIPRQGEPATITVSV